jgi:hypothetical protein
MAMAKFASPNTDGWQLNGTEIDVKYVKMTKNFLTDYHECKELVELFHELNEKQAAAADASEKTLIVKFFQMMD